MEEHAGRYNGIIISLLLKYLLTSIVKKYHRFNRPIESFCVHQSAAFIHSASLVSVAWLQGASAAPLRSSVMLSQSVLFIKVLIQLHWCFHYEKKNENLKEQSHSWSRYQIRFVLTDLPPHTWLIIMEESSIVAAVMTVDDTLSKPKLPFIKCLYFMYVEWNVLFYVSCVFFLLLLLWGSHSEVKRLLTEQGHDTVWSKMPSVVHFVMISRFYCHFTLQDYTMQL